MKTRGVAAFLALPILLALVACGGSSTTVSPSASPIASKSPSPTPKPTESPRTLTFKLDPIGDSKAHGTVVVDVTGDGYTITVTVLGLTPKSTHLINIHGGTCASMSFNVDIAVAQDVKADASGKATSLTTYHNAYAIPADGRILTVHGDTPADALSHIACAGMTN